MIVDEHYKVAIFGSARIKEGDKIYEEVFAISKGLAEHGFDVVTGGGPGLMLAANSGHRSSNTKTHSMGLNIRLPYEQISNSYVDIKEDFDRFSERLDSFVSLSDIVIVCPGGIGTLLELFYTWQLLQVEHLCEIPIILFGEMWSGLLDWLRDEVLSRGLFSQGDMNHLIHLNSPEDVVRLVRNLLDDRSKVEHVCHNFEKYRVEFHGQKKEPGGRYEGNYPKL